MTTVECGSTQFSSQQEEHKFEASLGYLARFCLKNIFKK
jgi:hypothetical protein